MTSQPEEPSGPGPSRWSIAATVVLIAAVLGLVATDGLVARGPVGLGLQALAVLLMLWARVTSGMRRSPAADPTAGALVTTGPYRYVRHPVSAAGLLFVWAGVATRATLVTIALALVVTAAAAVRIWVKERLVTARSPVYREYAARTKRVIPFVL